VEGWGRGQSWGGVGREEGEEKWGGGRVEKGKGGGGLRFGWR